MSSGASVSALQRLVEQLKLEASVERIKVRPPRSSRPRQNRGDPGPARPAGRGGRRPRARGTEPGPGAEDQAGLPPWWRLWTGTRRGPGMRATRWRPGLQ